MANSDVDLVKSLMKQGFLLPQHAAEVLRNLEDEKECFEITREIGIDAAHRVPYHESKCKNLHGHRYTIQATVSGSLKTGGSETGMVMDFSFLKQLMMDFIDANCDHGLIVYIDDRDLLGSIFRFDGTSEYHMWKEKIAPDIKKFGACKLMSVVGKTYIVPFIPTAENLAKHWFDLLAERVSMRTKQTAQLSRVRVWETPNSFCDYPAK